MSSFNSLSDNLVKARLLIYNDQFKDFLFKKMKYLLALADKHEFVALALLKNPSDLIQRLEEELLLPFSAVLPIHVVMDIAKNHKSCELIEIKDPIFRERLLQDEPLLYDRQTSLGMN